MRDDTTRQSVLFSDRDLFGKPLVAMFDQPHASSDGGAILLKAADARLRLSERLTACLNDGRQAGKMSHSLQELLRQRLFAIVCGYPDGNDAARGSQDPIHKLLCDREAIDGQALASQPTLSRFENAPDRKDLYRMGESLAETVIERHRRRLGKKVKHITIDLDPTGDPTHGAQQLTFFNGHYDEDAKLDYIVAMAENKVLARRTAPLMKQARRLSRASEATEHVYGECRYAAGEHGGAS